MNRELPGVQGGFRKDRGTRDQIANICWIIKKAREFKNNIYFCLMTMPKTLTMWITANSGKFFKRRACWTTLPVFWEICMQIKNQQLKLDMEQCTHPNWERSTSKLYIVTLLFLTYIQSISCEMPGWMKHKLESRLLGEISITSDMQLTPPLWQKAKN